MLLHPYSETHLNLKPTLDLIMPRMNVPKTLIVFPSAVHDRCHLNQVKHGLDVEMHF